MGTWGHGMAWPDRNEGREHGRLSGYGALNQCGLICHLSLVLAEKCGVKDAEVRGAIAGDQVAHWQVTFKLGFTLEPEG